MRRKGWVAGWSVGYGIPKLVGLFQCRVDLYGNRVAARDASAAMSSLEAAESTGHRTISTADGELLESFDPKRSYVVWRHDRFVVRLEGWTLPDGPGSHWMLSRLTGLAKVVAPKLPPTN